jgi:acyl carrier protein
MTKTFDTIADIISDVCNVEREKISPDSHVINDLGIDSLDFLDVTFAIDKSFGIKMPIQKWTEEVNVDNSKAERYFVMKNLCARIDELVAAKSA